MNENFEWFMDQYDNLRNIYGDSFLAINDKKVFVHIAAMEMP